MQKYSGLAVRLALITVIFGTIYTVGQQILRMNANDPQIQLAEDIAAKLSYAQPREVVPGVKINANISLSPFVIIYDKNGKPLAGNGYIDGSLPTIPKGVLDSSVGKEYNAVTWQIPPGYRFASVSATRSDDYFVTVARSLKEVEKRENQVFYMAAFGWACSVILLLAAAILQKKPTAKKSRK